MRSRRNVDHILLRCKRNLWSNESHENRALRNGTFRTYLCRNRRSLSRVFRQQCVGHLNSKGGSTRHSKSESSDTEPKKVEHVLFYVVKETRGAENYESRAHYETFRTCMCRNRRVHHRECFINSVLATSTPKVVAQDTRRARAQMRSRRKRTTFFYFVKETCGATKITRAVSVTNIQNLFVSTTTYSSSRVLCQQRLVHLSSKGGNTIHSKSESSDTEPKKAGHVLLRCQRNARQENRRVRVQNAEPKKVTVKTTF